MTQPVTPAGAPGAGSPGNGLRVDETKSVDPIGDKPKIDKSQFHVLVADSYDMTNKLIADSLTMQGFTVTAVTDHNLAFATFQRAIRPVSLVIVNQGGRGLWLIDQIKEALPNTTILLCTGNSGADKGKADGVLYKPFNNDALTGKVEELLGLKEPADQPSN